MLKYWHITLGQNLAHVSQKPTPNPHPPAFPCLCSVPPASARRRPCSRRRGGPSSGRLPWSGTRAHAHVARRRPAHPIPEVGKEDARGPDESPGSPALCLRHAAGPEVSGLEIFLCFWDSNWRLASLLCWICFAMWEVARTIVLVSETTWGKIMQLNEKKGVTSAESSRSVRGLGKGVSGKPYPRLCNARRPRLKPGTFWSQAVRLYRMH